MVRWIVRPVRLRLIRLLCVPASAIQLVYVLTSLVGRARCSSVVRVFAHGAVDRQISSS